MKKYLKLLIFILTFSIFNFLKAENSFALTFSSPEEVCNSELFNDCEISDGKVIINLTSPIEIDSQLYFDVDEIEINDLTDSDNSITISENYGYNSLLEFKHESKVTLNNLKLKLKDNIIFAFVVNAGTDITLNNGDISTALLMDIHENAKITLNNVTVSVKNTLFDDTSRAESIIINGGTYTSFGRSVINMVFLKPILTLTAGTFAVESNLPEARVFYGYNALAEEVKTLIEGSIPETSMIYDVEHNTEIIEYSEIDLGEYYPELIDEKGTKDFGIINSRKILITEKTGRGEEPETPVSEEPETPTTEEPETEEELKPEPAETEENPNTLVDHPASYFIVVLLTTLSLTFSAKKYLES